MKIITKHLDQIYFFLQDLSCYAAKIRNRWLAMIRLKKFFGDYTQLIHQLDLPPAFSDAQQLEEYRNQITLDLPRICYFSDKYTVNEMKTRLSNLSHLFNIQKGILRDTTRPLSYTQGNFNAAVFSKTIISKILAQGDTDQLNPEGLYAYWSTTYVDDDDIYSGITISYLKNDPALKLSRPLAEGVKGGCLYSLCVIKNVNLAPIDRQVIYLTHPALLTPGIDPSYAEEVKLSDLVNVIAPSINSRSLTCLIANLFNENEFSLRKFEELKNQYQTKSNNCIHFLPRNLSDLFIIILSLVLAIGLPLLSLPLVTTNVLIPSMAIATVFFIVLAFFSAIKIVYNELILWSIPSLPSSYQGRFEKEISTVGVTGSENSLSGFLKMFHLTDKLASASAAAKKDDEQITALRNSANKGTEIKKEEIDKLPSVGYSAL